MHHRFWEDAVATMCNLQNMTPHRALEGAIPFTLWYDQYPDMSHLKVFGVVAYTYIQSKSSVVTMEGNLLQKSRKGFANDMGSFIKN